MAHLDHRDLPPFMGQPNRLDRHELRVSDSEGVEVVDDVGERVILGEVEVDLEISSD